MKTACGILSVLFYLFGSLPQAQASVLCSANPSNLVTNCGFETGSLAGWTVTGNDVPEALNNLYGVEGTDPFDFIAPHSGSYQLFLADLDSNATTISQTLPTIAGYIYNISFYLVLSGSGYNTWCRRILE